MTTDKHLDAPAWRYVINYWPDGEASYANIYNETGALVGNLKTHLAVAIVEAMNRRTPPHSEGLREALGKIAALSQDSADPDLNSEVSFGNWDDVFYDGERQAHYECAAIARAALSGAQSPETLEAYYAAKDERIAELEAALEPFAFAANAYDPVEGDDDLTAFDHQFSIGQLRRARALTKRGEGQ